MDSTGSNSGIDLDFATDLPAPASAVDDRSGLWGLLRMMASDQHRLAAMRLVRWDGAGGEAALLRSRTAGVLRPDDVFVRYDATSFLVICAAPSDSTLGRIDREFGIPSSEAPTVGVWRPVTLGETGFAFLPVTAAGVEGEKMRTRTKPDRAVLTDARFRYFPLWDVEANFTFCYLCEALWDSGTGDLLPEDAFEGGLGGTGRILAVDLQVLREAIKRIETAMNEYGTLTALIPVHWQTLADRERADRYGRFCSDNVWPVIENVFFELVGTPPSLSESDPVRIAETVAQFSRGVFLRVPLDFEEFDQVSVDHFLSVGVSIRHRDQADPGIAAALKHFASRAVSGGHRCYVHGLTTMPLSAAAVRAGFTYVGSDVVASPLDAEDTRTESPDPAALLRQFRETSGSR